MIYMDHNATTPTDPRVVEAMLPYLLERWGNTGSRHPWGQAARRGLEQAREQVAALLGAHADEIIFTSGGTESNNLAIMGVANARPHRRAYLTSVVEHPAVREPLLQLERSGAQLTVLGVGSTGRALLPDRVHDGTNLVSLMLANNEVGALQPVAALSQLARAAGALMHTDAAQAVGKVPVNVDELGVDMLSLAGHKMYAPKGVGALYVRRGTPIEPWSRGGGQERGLRPGTPDVASAVALGFAAGIAMHGLTDEAQRQTALRERLWAGLVEGVPGVRRHGDELSLPNTLNVGFPGVTGPAVLERAPGVAASTGSACHEGEAMVPSAVLTAMGVTQAIGAVRLSLGRGTTEAEVDEVIAQLVRGWGLARGEFNVDV